MPPLASASSLTLALPELVLSLGVLVVLALSLGRALPRQVPAAVTIAFCVATIAATLATDTGAAQAIFDGLIVRDRFADFFKLLAPLCLIVVALLSIYARDAIDFARPRGAGEDREAPEFFALLLAAALGAQLMAAATDLLLAYLALELTSIMSYVLTGFSRGDRRSAEAALKYVVYGGVASGAMLYGLSLLYGLAVSTEIGAVRAALVAAPAPVALAAVALCLAGLGYKVAVVPFHMWCPDVYQGAPTPVAAFLSVAPKAGGFALLVRFFGGESAGPATIPWEMLALVIAVTTMTLGNLAALGQRNLKRLLAYSSIAHAGYLFLGLAAGAPAGHHAILFYLGAYLFMNLAAFGVVVAVAAVAPAGADPAEITSYTGLSRRAPALAFVMAVVLFALAGLPPTAGFIGKYYLFSALVAAGRAQGDGAFLVAALIAVVNSVISLAYYLRVVRAMYLDPAPDAAPARPAAALVVVLGALCAATVLLGIYWAPLDRVASEAVRSSALRLAATPALADHVP